MFLHVTLAQEPKHLHSFLTQSSYISRNSHSVAALELRLSSSKWNTKNIAHLSKQNAKEKRLLREGSNFQPPD